MPSVVNICNASLLRIGDQTITALTEDSKQARTCNILYEIIRDDLISKHNWNFAKARAELAQTSNTPDFEYTYTYTLPVDMLRITHLYGTTAYWQREGNEILINDTEVNLKYIKRIEDPTLFPAYFTTSLVQYLSLALCERLSDDTELKSTLMIEFAQGINEAKRMNAIESFGEPENDDDSDWQEAGH